MDASTSFGTIYDSFFSKITDDMYMELSRQETEGMVQDLFLGAIHWFEFPRFDLYDFDLDLGEYNIGLTKEEVNIISMYMVVEWLGQQLASVENTRMKYSGSDFKFTSQANHMQKLLQLQKDYQRKGFHLQRLYKRRYKGVDGRIHSNMGVIMAPITNRQKEVRREAQV